MKNIFYSKSIDARINFIKDYFTSIEADRIFYLCPKKFIPDISERLSEVKIFAYEDVTKSNELFNLASDDILLVLDRPSRYKTITSNNFVRLSRISAKYKNKAMVDIVPFTTGIEYLYSPLAFIDRGILGYQHWYSFRENNWELVDGKKYRAHDFDFLAKKLSKVAGIDYNTFFGHQIEIVDSPLTKEEAIEYKSLRDKLFEENTTAGPIITKLADWTNIRESRYDKLNDLIESPSKKIIYTNLAGHNKRLKKRFKNIEIKSFYDTNGNEDKYDVVILFEMPIIKNYLFLDVIANVRKDTKIYIFKSNTTVEKYLYKKMFDEYSQINQLTAALYKEVRRERGE